MSMKWSGMNSVEYPRSSILRAFSRQSAAEVAFDDLDAEAELAVVRHGVSLRVRSDRSVRCRRASRPAARSGRSSPPGARGSSSASGRAAVAASSSISSVVPTSATGESSTCSGVDSKNGAIASAMDFESSVKWTNPASTWISRSSNRSPAASRTHASFWSVASRFIDGAVAGSSATPLCRLALMPTMSASRAASESTRFPPPPMMIGGCGRCTGFGSPSRPSTR